MRCFRKILIPKVLSGWKVTDNNFSVSLFLLPMLVLPCSSYPLYSCSIFYYPYLSPLPDIPAPTPAPAPPPSHVFLFPNETPPFFGYPSTAPTWAPSSAPIYAPCSAPTPAPSSAPTPATNNIIFFCPYSCSFSCPYSCSPCGLMHPPPPETWILPPGTGLRLQGRNKRSNQLAQITGATMDSHFLWTSRVSTPCSRVQGGCSTNILTN